MTGLGCGTLDDLNALVDDCRRCRLSETRNHLVLGAGSPRARVVIIGEAPGRNEDLRGEPFVGAAGKFLDELLAHAGLRRDDVFIANVLKCRPPGNRDPRPDEIECCTPYLGEQLRLIAPDVLVTLGNFATRFVLETDAPISQLRGTPVREDDLVVLPVFHPAAAIYDRSKREVLLNDFGLLRRLLNGEVDVS